MINVSSNKGIFPDFLKVANDIPMHKKDEKLDPNNYRPISLLSNISKLYKKVFQGLKVLLIVFFIILSLGLLVLIVLHQFLFQQMLFFTNFSNFIQQDFFLNVPFINGFVYSLPQPPSLSL